MFCCADFRSDSGVDLHIVCDSDAVVRIDFGTHSSDAIDCQPQDSAAIADAVRQLNEYFNGNRTSFDLPVKPQGTPFQLQVWNALQTIPYGETRSYSDIAKQIGSPSAVRAVGAANGRNPIPVVIPCHRVIGSNGSLTGFGGGLPLKKLLLQLESRTGSLWT